MTWTGSDPSLPSILLNSHTDVVPVVADAWSVDPFAADLESDGRIIARGSQDMKCVGMGYLEALRRLKRSEFVPLRTIHLSFVPDEEIGGGDGMKLFAQTTKFKALNVGVALDEGVPSPFEQMFIFNQERAPWWIKITAHGVAGHGSILPQGSATEKLVPDIGGAAVYIFLVPRHAEGVQV